jgi:hypothetical protein
MPKPASSVTRFKLSLAALVLLVFYASQSVNAQKMEKEKLSFKDQFVDSTDNAFDVSAWMSQVYGFFPLVTIITEPATGFGLSGGLIHIKRHKKTKDDGSPIPPDLSLIGGLYTESGTWGVIAFHRGHWKKDKIRFDGALGYLSANLNVYRQAPIGSNVLKIGFNIEGPVFVPAFRFRIKDSRSFVGVEYTLLDLNVTFDLPFDQLPEDLASFSATLSGLGGLYTWDSRDNTFTPNRGMYANSSWTYYDELIGSDYDYTRIDSYWLGFSDFLNNTVLGMRVDYRVALNDPPFYSLPFVVLRGVPAYRYQGQHVLVLETEERWDFSRRWSLAGFAGVGMSFQGPSTSETAYSLGGGIRYHLARIFNIYSGVDVARGPEQWAVYIQFGHYWNSL